MRYWMRGGDENEPDPAIALASEAAYIDFAQFALEHAVSLALDVQGGRIPYQADGLFDTDEGQLLGRCARLGALRDDPWYAKAIASLLPAVSVAPTAAKTLPSQSVAIALGHAVEAVPTPEGVTALRAALALVRHAGVEKKLDRNLKQAVRGLATRPDIALRLALTSAPDKRQDKKRLTMLASCLEAGWYQGLSMDWSVWHRNLATAAGGQALANSLVWEALEPGLAFMLDPKSALPCGADGQALEIDTQGTVRLWHPLQASESERKAWKAAIMRRKIVQTPRQVFREIYLPLDGEGDSAESILFAGHRVSLLPLIGVGRREGWQMEHGGLVRQFGLVRARFAIGASLYPGASGHADTGALHFSRRDGRQWTALAQRDLPPLVFSEIARAVDLMVSISAFAIDDGQDTGPITTHARADRLDRLSDMPLGEMGRARRDVLAIAFADHLADGRVHFEGNRLRVGQYSVHLNTARVMDGSAPYALEAGGPSMTLSALPWLPYDEVLLQKIVDEVAQLLAL
jgi:hypothetical protein